MKEILEKALTDGAARKPQAIEDIAVEPSNDSFLSWDS